MKLLLARGTRPSKAGCDEITELFTSMCEIRRNPSNQMHTAVYIAPKQPQIPKYHFIVRQNRTNQVFPVSDTLEGI